METMATGVCLGFCCLFVFGLVCLHGAYKRSSEPSFGYTSRWHATTMQSERSMREKYKQKEGKT